MVAEVCGERASEEQSGAGHDHLRVYSTCERVNYSQAGCLLHDK